jgi:hypothetical protein
MESHELGFGHADDVDVPEGFEGVFTKQPLEPGGVKLPHHDVEVGLTVSLPGIRDRAVEGQGHAWFYTDVGDDVDDVDEV